jgi:hypothetical protein
MAQLTKRADLASAPSISGTGLIVNFPQLAIKPPIYV